MTKIETGIYWIENIKTGDCYVGQTSRPFQIRDDEHDKALLNRLHSNAKLQRAFNKYGRKAFKFKILERAERNLNKLEDKWILKKQAFYNVRWSDGSLIERDEDGKIKERKAAKNRFDDPFLKLALVCALVLIIMDAIK